MLTAKSNVRELELTKRMYSALERFCSCYMRIDFEFMTIGDLIKICSDDLLSFENFGPKSLYVLNETLKKHGFDELGIKSDPVTPEGMRQRANRLKLCPTCNQRIRNKRWGRAYANNER